MAVDSMRKFLRREVDLGEVKLKKSRTSFRKERTGWTDVAVVRRPDRGYLLSIQGLSRFRPFAGSPILAMFDRAIAW
jgi:hypothetical protein